jgi:parallel beta-helix repeat protein
MIKRKAILVLNIYVIFILVTIILPIVLCYETTSNTLYVDYDGSKEYSSISEAINNALDGDIIYVYSGIYPGYLLINKSISIIGENRDSTVVSGAFTPPALGGVFEITADNVTISNLTIKYGIIPKYGKAASDLYLFGIGIYIQSSNNSIIGNNIQQNYGYGIRINNSKNTIISDNNITNPRSLGIFLENSDNNIIMKNNITKNERGIGIHNSSNNNSIYFNNFINNSNYNAWDEGQNLWYNTNEKMGNYWDKYYGSDDNNDNIGDITKTIPGTENEDRYPLMKPYEDMMMDQILIDEGTLYFMLIIGCIIAIIVCLPIAYYWRKKMGY